jgi:CubicO group peptidase (beta-lactamase class C family)
VTVCSTCQLTPLLFVGSHPPICLPCRTRSLRGPPIRIPLDLPRFFRMKDLLARLSLLAPTFDQIASLSGVPGVSIGVLHHGDVVFRYNYGYRDMESGEPTTTHTIYPIASLSKAITALVYGSLVSDGILDWHSPIRNILPEFRSKAEEVERLASAADLLAHRTGIHGRYFPLLNDSSIIPMFSVLPQQQQFRAKMQYNNLGYAIVAMAMSKQTGLSYEELLHQKILRPLNLTRTGLTFHPHDTEDLAKTYMVTPDGLAVENRRPMFESGSYMAAGSGIRSSVDELLVLYREVLREALQPSALSGNTTARTPLREVRTVLSGHVPLGGKHTGILEQTYGLGWIRTQLPGELGAMGLDSWLMERMPVAGQDTHSRLAIYHQGNSPGATSAVYLFPETQSGIVVLANAYGLSDVPNWISQAIMDVLFHHVSVDYIQLTREAIIKYQEYCAKTQDDLVLLQGREPDRASFGDVGGFVGDYRNAADFFIIRVSRHGDDSLRLAFQGLQEETFLLYPSHDECYTWFSSFLDMARRGRHISPASYYIVCFRRNPLGKVMALEWAHNSDVAGELFFKTVDDGRLETMLPRVVATVFSAVPLILIYMCLRRFLL